MFVGAGGKEVCSTEMAMGSFTVSSYAASEIF